MINAAAVAIRIEGLRREQQRLLQAAVGLDSDEIIEDQIAALDAEIVELRRSMEAEKGNIIKLR